MILPRRGHAALLALLACLAAPRAAQAGSNADCLRCHGMAGFAGRAATGEVRSLAVDPQQFARSEHGHLACTVCHSRSYSRFPHPHPARTIECLNCHGKNQGSAEGVSFADIQSEFHQSMHAVRHPDSFSCASCHDTHRFRRWKDASRSSIAQQNGVCLACHKSEARFERITRRPLPNLQTAHEWLPHRDLHWQHVRCLDCHSSYQAPARSHRILPARQAVRDCVACHSANSVLKLKLYRHTRQAETARLGFINAMIVNNAYVIGATRNRYLDTAGILLLVLTALGATAHGLLRLGLGRRRGGSASHE